MADQTTGAGQQDTDGREDGAGRGVGRRAVLRAGGVGGAAAAVIVGLGLRPEAAAASPGQTTQLGTPTRSPLSRLTAGDPHQFTIRTRQNGTGQAPTLAVLPIDRAKFLVGARFDLRVEAGGVDPQTARIDIEVSGPPGAREILTGDPVRGSSAPDRLEVTYPQVAFRVSGTYTVRASVRSGGRKAHASVTYQVVKAKVGNHPPVKNIIFFLGDGMGQPAITAARVMSKGITEGKYHGMLEMDTMDHRGLVGTSGVDALATDSANSMSAYMTGHKSSVNAMGVYVGGDQSDPNNHPRVENIAELLKRTRGMAIGVVTTAEVQDATPAAVWAHTRRRAEYVEIMDQALEPGQMPDVLLGGGLHALLPQSDPRSRRQDDRDLVAEFKQRGFAYASTRRELKKAIKGRPPRRLLGTFQVGNMNVYLDRQHAPNPDVLGEWDDQPNLMEMTDAALKVLSQNRNGFFLMVEAASIDKMEHPLDGPRVVYDTIEFDQALGVAKRWAKRHGDTLIVVTADHNHSMSIVGTHDKREDAQGRANNGVYGDATFPTYADRDGDGFPDDPAPEVELFFGWSNHPDHTDDYHHNPVFRQPALLDENGVAVPNPTRDPDAELQVGNLPFNQTNCVHTVEDVPVFAAGPGAARFNAFLDNTEVFHAMMDALGLDVLAEDR